MTAPNGSNERPNRGDEVQVAGSIGNIVRMNDREGTCVIAWWMPYGGPGFGEESSHDVPLDGLHIRQRATTSTPPPVEDGRPDTGALVALAHEGGSEHVPSVDVCAFCWDSECDGIVCISNLDPDDPDHHDSIERLHILLRAGHALLAPSPGTGDDGSGT